VLAVTLYGQREAHLCLSGEELKMKDTWEADQDGETWGNSACFYYLFNIMLLVSRASADVASTGTTRG
jgi:hypothetical protein